MEGVFELNSERNKTNVTFYEEVINECHKDKFGIWADGWDAVDLGLNLHYVTKRSDHTCPSNS